MQFFLSFSPLDARRRFLEWKQETNQSYQTESRGNVIISNDHDDCFFHYRSFDTVVSIESLALPEVDTMLSTLNCL